MDERMGKRGRWGFGGVIWGKVGVLSI